MVGVSRWIGRGPERPRGGWRPGLAVAMLAVGLVAPMLWSVPAQAQLGGAQVSSVMASASTATVGQTVILTAQVSGNLLGTAVAFTIISGPNAGASLASCQVQLLQQSCSTSYSSTISGTDTIEADAPGQSGGPNVSVSWLGVPALVLVSPPASFTNVNSNVSVNATVYDTNGNPVSGNQVQFTASGTGGENPSSQSATTNGSGVASFTYTSTAPGKSTVVAAAATPNGGSVTGSATATFAGPPATIKLTQQNQGGLAPVGGTDTVTAALADSVGDPVGDGTNVNFLVTGAGAQTGHAPTSGGNAIFTFSSNVTGTSTITASAGSLTSMPVTATWEPAIASSITLTPRNASAVIGTPQVLIAQVLDQFGQPFEGALVRFAIGGANAVATTSSGDTDASGKVGFQYSGTNVGIDTVAAFVDLNDDDTLDPGDPYATSAIFWKNKPGQGYWLAASDGGIFNYGPDAPQEGSLGGRHLNKPIVGMATTPDGGGYWLVASDGGIFGFGDAAFQGSTGGMHINQPIVGMAATPDGQGYWLVASDGGIFAYGDATFYGSTGGMHINQPIVGMAPSGTGAGYWLVASDGGIFAYGDAPFYGSTGSMHLNKPIVGMAAISDNSGYFFVASDGGIFNYGPGSSFFGSAGSTHLNAPIVAMAVAP